MTRGFAETEFVVKPPHPSLSPRGEGKARVEIVETASVAKNSIAENETPPLPSGRGQGEGAVKPNPPSHDITKRSAGKTEFARKLRADETEEEYFLWSDLRNRRLNGYKFARQIPLGPYVVDFLCRELHLVIELDGGQHGESMADVRRTEWLNINGYSVLRFWNNEVRFERMAVLETIFAVLEGRIFIKDDAVRFSPSIESNAVARPPHPNLSPRGEGKAGLEIVETASVAKNSVIQNEAPPLPPGRGPGEGALPKSNRIQRVIHK